MMTDKPHTLDLSNPADREWLAANLERVDLGSVRIIPVGAEKPLPGFTEQDLIVTPEEEARYIRNWNEMMPAEWRGILEAKIATPKKPKKPKRRANL